MVVYVGSVGSLCCYDKGVLVASGPLSEKITMEYYQDEAYRLIKEGLQKGYDLLEVTYAFCLALQGALKQKKYKRTRSDEKFIVMYYLCLVKLKHFDFDDVMLVCLKKKKKIKKPNK